MFVGCFFFFKQKTAYEMSISDWSSDVCSSDLRRRARLGSASRRGDSGCRDLRPIDPPVPGRLMIRPIWPAGALSILLILAGCGSGADDRPDTGNTAATTAVEPTTTAASSPAADPAFAPACDRKSVWVGKRGSGRVDIGGGRNNKKK